MVRHARVQRAFAIGLVTIGAALALPAVATAAPSYRVESFATDSAVPGTFRMNLFGIGTPSASVSVRTLSTTNPNPRAHLPFPITFYGKQYTSIKVAGNGTIQFGGSGSGSNNMANERLPSNALGDRGFLAAFWDELHYDLAETGQNVYIKTVRSAPHRHFIVWWAAEYDDQRRGRFSLDFQAVFREDSP